MAVKKKDHENLSDANIKKVIDLLDKGSTKKEACSVLNIAYNTKRLGTIIEQFTKTQAHKKKMRASKRGKKADDSEISTVAQEFLTGSPVSEIATRMYRSPGFVKAIIQKLGIPEKVSKSKMDGPQMLPEPCVAESFAIDQVVWSSVYNAPAIVKTELDGDYEDMYASKAYRIYVMEKMRHSPDSLFPSVNSGGFYANSLAYDLGDLKHLEEYKIRWDFI